MKPQAFLAEIKGGQVILDVRAWKQMVADGEGKEIELYVEERGRSHPTRAQLRYFHGVVCKSIVKHTEAAGYTLKEVKAALKSEFLMIGDGEYELCRSVASLSPTEMSEFIDQCIQWAAEKLHLVISDPKPKQVAS